MNLKTLRMIRRRSRHNETSTSTRVRPTLSMLSTHRSLLAVNTQIQEVAQMQQSVYELERAYHKMRQQYLRSCLVSADDTSFLHRYEEEILRLRRELESRGIALPPSAVQLSSGARA
jgi:hypothetical protein